MSQRPTTIAIVGTGSIGFRHLSILRAVPYIRVIAIPTRIERHAELVRMGFLACETINAAADLGATLAIIATNTGRHVEDALAAVESRLDLLVEKPLGTNSQEASRLCVRAGEAGRKIFVGCVLRFSESLNTFRNLQSRIGRLHFVRIECQSYLPDWRPGRAYRDSYSARPDEGGVLRDLIHEIDYAGWIFGWPRSVQAYLRNLGRLGIEAEEAADLTWQMPEGSLVSISLDYLSRPPRRSMRAFGELGTLEWNGMENTVTLALADCTPQVIKSSQSRDEMFLVQDRAFIEASHGVDDPRLATGEDGVKALSVCDAARRASRNRREEPVVYP